MIAVEANLQRRVQRYGWDRAAQDYEPLWQSQLAPARQALLAGAAIARGHAVLDVACGTGLVTFEAARAAGADGRILGTDLSGEMVRLARQRALAAGLTNVRFERMDAEALTVATADFDVVLCALGLMYPADPLRAARELRRAVRPGGRVALAVWGERERCGWAPVFPIVQAEVASEVCPLFFRLGRPQALADLSRQVGLRVLSEERISTYLRYETSQQACAAAFVGGPVALAWARFDETTRARAYLTYRQAIEPWRSGEGFRIPAEFVIVHAVAEP